MTPFLLSLALSDLMFSSIGIPPVALRFYKKSRIFDDFTCQLFPYFFIANLYTSAFSMTFVALNR